MAGYEWRLPDVGEGIHEAEIVRWHVQAGDNVDIDQPLVEIQTDKATVDIGSPVKGRVSQVLAQEGDVVEVGTVVITFDQENSDTVDAPAATAAHGATTQSRPPCATGPTVAPRGEPQRRALASPAVRKLARDLHVDIQAVVGSGEGGRVLADDVRRAGEAPAVAPKAPDIAPNASQAEVRVALRGTRRVIAEHMVRSKFTAPHVSTMDEVDVSQLVALREQMKEAAQSARIKLTYLPFVVQAVVAALKRYPYLNASLDEKAQEIVLKSYYHIGIAVDDPDGLVVPVVRNADQKSLGAIAREIQDLTERAHQHLLTREEMSGSTFTVTNYGSFGGMFATPIINYPEVAVFGTGRIQKRAVVLDDNEIVVRPVMTVCLTFDHRVVDGGMAGRFTNEVMRYLRRPAELFLERS
ncbi:MAG: dienelactone hydrolase [Sulfobacillus acidophilus]|uniref:Dihydrolipoamide acetyltransferase component of pyruvate dehydrogenase complex n=1 Tax=Sulfobacillus acidophilus TaxID=53633 RepID=A0A2T2WKV8_9FIRM|nr:MAG: dienelactone hydrolase [Sulfobacillus acidophilus]